MIQVNVPNGAGGIPLSLWLSQAGYSVVLPCGGAGRCGNCRIRVLSGRLCDRDHPEKTLIPDENGEVRACKALLSDEVTVIGIPDGWDAPKSEKPPRFYPTAALDLGTTTLALRLRDENGNVLESTSANPECVFGADVASRITATEKHGVVTVRECLLDRLRALLSGCTVGRMSVVGNPTMIHILAGVSPASIGISPFVPVFSDEKVLSGDALGLPIGEIVLLPGVRDAGYLGSDLTAGAFASGILDSPVPAIYLDLGTNGELLLTTGTENGGHLYAASCAVGPCFEGAGIGSGVGGIPGAVSRVSYRDGSFVFSTVDDFPPIGITGSGLIDLFALLLLDGTIKRDGRLQRSFQLSGSQSFQNGTISSPMQTPVKIEQRDVRAVQTAKAAVRAGISAMLRASWMEPEDVGRVLIAGSFGKYLDPAAASAIGLFPPEWTEDATAVGNAALEGAERSLLSPNALAGVKRIAATAHIVDLNSSLAFREAFLNRMDF